MEIKSIGKDNFKEEVLDSKVPVLVDFNADWCGPCKMIRPILDELALESDDYKIVSINVDNEDEIAMEYGVSSIPCLVLFKDGKENNRTVGFMPKEEIENFIKGE